MLSKSSKLSKKRTGILKAFTDTISNLEGLVKTADVGLEKEQKKINEAQAEKKALQDEKKLLTTTVDNIKKVIGLEPVEKTDA